MNYEKIIVNWMEFKIPKTLPRTKKIKLNHEFITTITGPRRAGKTYLCFQTMHQLISNKVPKENILYINFEDEKLLGANANDLNKLLETYLELSNNNEKYETYLFLDEIQNVTNWDNWVRRISDTEKNIKLILTGSSSKLLSKEISTQLRGRVLNTEIYPLSFKEYLDWNKITYDLKTLLHSKKKIAVKKAFSKYLKNGGYPALLTNNAPREKILQNYYQSMIFKDIVERHKIKEIKKLKILVKLLFEATSNEISYNKLTNKLKSMGFNISTNTIIEYLHYFEDAYLFFQNLKYEYSLTKQLGAIKKVYCIDNGILNAVSFKFSEDNGKLLENLAFIELKRRGNTVYYHREKKECDFLIIEKSIVTNAIQITKELTDENHDREINGLLEALNKYNLTQGIILILTDDEKQLKIKGKTIHITPIWKWLLNN